MTFVIALLTQIVLWHIHPIKQEMRWLFLLMLLMPLLPLAIISHYLQLNGTEIIAAVLIWLSLAVSYIQTYPALKEDIPTFKLLLFIASQQQGVTTDDIMTYISQQNLVKRKLDELHNDSLLIEQRGRLYLSPTGRLLASCFALYRRLLGLKMGDG